ncbi:MAG TPA: HAMP domain-containing sensor histidine kinase [Pyrinomonadaceae bacterium]|nr:HAMP domain-containing sensor histidine kinase [Pyrinomonadaceae bacterium]
MRLPGLFYSFRTRLLLVMVLLLIGTLGVQYYLFRREELRRAVIIAEQEQALAASTALALASITSDPPVYLWQLDAKRPVSFLQEQQGRVVNILVVRWDGRVDDSLDPQYAPATLEDGSYRYFNIKDVPLPRLVEAGQTTTNIRQLIPEYTADTGQPIAGEPRAFPIPVETSKGPNYIIVMLGAAKTPHNDSWGDVVGPLLPTLAVFLLATFAAGVLVWRFTRPVKELSHATHRVAAGDFSFHVPGADRRDEIGGLAATFNEMVTQLGRMRELESQIKQAEQSAVIGRLASAIAHEIRNPLNYINLALDHLRTSLAPQDPQKREQVEQLTAQLKTEVARINTRVSEFLKYSRPASLNLQPLDLRDTLRDALRMVEVQAADSGVETSLDDRGATPTVLGDRESLRSLFTNLIINGMHAMEGQGGGRLTVGLTSENGRARVSISDTGRGIESGDMPKIFEPYFSTKETGTGLGLAIVKKAVEDHDGSISVESKPGEGTTFTVEIPTQERMKSER